MLLGFDIGGTKCAVILGTDNLDIVDKKRVDTNLPVYEMIELLFTEAETLLTQHNIPLEAITGIGISCGGPLSSKKGLILSPPNLVGWDNIPIVDLTQKRFNNKPTLLQNDANACAVAEWKYGAGRGTDNLIFLTFGTGMGAGLILDGRLYSGPSDLAGEVGHIRLDHIGPVGFGKAGSFEGYCSGGGLAQLGQIKARERIQVGQSVSYCKSIEDLSSITARTIADAAINGDPTAKEVYELSAEYLGRAIAMFVDLLNPELIILGSIYGRAKQLIDPKMYEVIKKEAYHGSLENFRILPAGLGESIGDMAALSLAVMVGSEQLVE
ncbi:MAG: ROK family protein [Bacteroidetes bacterium]|nr:ROK family protein [Bacteroidota bacterium]